jgi:hypothetical protein
MIDIIYIIVSSEFEKDRLNYLQKYINENFIKYKDSIKYYEPYYKNRDEKLIKEYNYHSKLKIAEKMLFSTYTKMFKEILELKYENILILESDVLFLNDFENRLDEIYNEWISNRKNEVSMIFLGNGCNLIPNENNKISNNLYLQNSSKCTDSMLCSYKCIDYVNNYINKLNIIDKPIDFMLNEILGEKCNGYWIKYPMVIQGSQNGTYKSTIQSQ